MRTHVETGDMDMIAQALMNATAMAHARDDDLRRKAKRD